MILWVIRLAIIAAIIGAVTYAVHLYNESVRDQLRKEFLVKEQGYKDTIAIDEKTITTLQVSVKDTEAKIAEANKRADDFAKDVEENKTASREAIAQEKANGAYARQEAARWRTVAKTVTKPGPFAQEAQEADGILSQYQTEALARDAKLVILGLK